MRKVIDYEDETEIGRILLSVVECASDSFYAAYNADETKRLYSEVSGLLTAHGLNVPQDPDLSDF